MTRLEDITATARVFAGTLSDDRKAVLERLCAASDSAMLGRLREGVTPADCYDSYVCACAWMALSALDGARDGGVEAFTAGTLSVRRASGASACRAMQAEVMMSPYLRDGSFAFRRV